MTRPAPWALNEDRRSELVTTIVAPELTDTALPALTFARHTVPLVTVMAVGTLPVMVRLQAGRASTAAPAALATAGTSPSPTTPTTANRTKVPLIDMIASCPGM